jgi:hypothetical protein
MPNPSTIAHDDQPTIADGHSEVQGNIDVARSIVAEIAHSLRREIPTGLNGSSDEGLTAVLDHCMQQRGRGADHGGVLVVVVFG